MPYKIKPVSPSKNLYIKTNAGAAYATFASGSRPYLLVVSDAVYATLSSNLESLKATGDLTVDYLPDDAPVKTEVRVVSTSNITLSGEQTIDSVAVKDKDRVLVAGNTDGSENGIYECASGAAWTRAGDMEDSGQIHGSVLIPVTEGTTNHDTIWIVTTNDPIILGTTVLTIEAYSSL